MKRASLVAAATLSLIACSFTLALADDTTNAPSPAVKATPAAPAAKATPGTPAEQASPVAKAATDKAVGAIDAQIAANRPDKKLPTWKTTLKKPTVVQFDPAKKYFVRMQTTEGTVLIRMMPDVAPMHVTNFLYLARLGFYDGTVFHRVITNFMAQGGDPLGNGTGGPGYQFAGEFSDKARHDHPGLLSMANAGPGTDGSQFFLTFVPTPWLNGKHTIFGEVVEGLDVLKKLEAGGTPQGPTTKKMSIVKCTVEVS